MQKKNIKHIVIGMGEVGTAIYNILKSEYTTYGIDKDDKPEIAEHDKKRKNILHICFPYNNNFIKDIRNYWAQYMPELVVVHSTVPIGTTRKLGGTAVFSPIRGVHPDLSKGIKTFVKYFGGSDVDKVKLAMSFFNKVDITTKATLTPEDAEAGKIMSTVYYGWNIIFEKYLWEFCQENNLDFDMVYKDFNETYNEGYTRLGKDNVVRPVLDHMKGKIGGHCVVENCDFVKHFKPAKEIKNKNKNISICT